MDKLETKRLIIKSFTEEYLSEHYVRWLNDKNTMQYSDQRFIIHTLESCRNYWESFKDSNNEFWAILKKNGKDFQHIGNITTYADDLHKVVDISIMIGEKSARGKGLGLEAWLGMCQYLQNIKNVRKITAGTLEVNKPMLKLMEKSGMIEDGRRKHHCLYEGKEVDLIHSALFRKD